MVHESQHDFGDFYNKEARHYDQRRFSCLCQTIYARMQVDFALAFLSGCRRVLEAGCGTGRFTVELARAGHTLTALDFSPNMLDQARSKAEALGVADHVTFRVGNIEHIDAPNAGFDAAFTNAVIRHFPSPARSIAELARVTRPGGVVVLDFLNRPMYDLADAARAAAGLPERKTPKGFFRNYHWSLDEVRRHMRRSGLRLVATRSFSKFPAHLVLDRLKLRWLAGPVEFFERSVNWGAVTMVKGIKR